MNVSKFLAKTSRVTSLLFWTRNSLCRKGLSAVIAAVATSTTLFVVGCRGGDGGATSESHSGAPSSNAPLRGPHGGRQFQTDDFAIEVTIYEPDIPPQSRIYAYHNGTLLDPSEVSVVTELHRINKVDVIHYHKQDDYLQGDKIVEEPHSFDVVVNATYHGRDYSWSYSSYEGRTMLSDAAIESTGIKIEKVGGGRITSKRVFFGRVTPNMQKVASLTARFPGIVKDLKVLPGSKIEKGDVLAVIEANDSLRSYEILAPRSGDVLNVSASVGEGVSGTSPIVTIGDLSSVWLDLVVPTREATSLKVGQKVVLPEDYKSPEAKSLEGRIVFISSVVDGDTQTRLVRAEVPNERRSLFPGTYVEAKVITGERDVPVVINAEALQKFRDWDVVFTKIGHTFEIAILQLGEVDGDIVEVKEGLTPGVEYATINSFVVKADVMKSSATHDH
jgi:membrane fusion protein, heavy metal efflux system